MRFEVSEQIHTQQDKEKIISALETQLRNISKVTRNGDALMASAIEASFGSINRTDKTVISVRKRERGMLCLAEVTYRPSVMFWIFFVIGLFAYGLFFWVPIIFYLVQRKTVRSAIAEVFTRVKNEFETDAASENLGLADLEKLAALHEKGVLTEAEFQSKKAEILGVLNIKSAAPAATA